MVRKRGRSRRSHGIKRAKKQRIKLDPRTISLRFKERIEPMSTNISYWLNLLDQLEKEILPLLVKAGIPTEEFVNYLAYSKRLFSKVSRFRALTLFNEILNWIAIFVTRGLKKDVLESLVDPIFSVWERQFIVPVIDYLKYELTFGPAIKPNYFYENFISLVLSKKEEIVPNFSYEKQIFYSLTTVPAPIPEFPYKNFISYEFDWLLPFKPFIKYRNFTSYELASGIPLIPTYEYKNFISYEFVQVSPLNYKGFFSYDLEKGIPFVPTKEEKNFVKYSLATSLTGG